MELPRTDLVGAKYVEKLRAEFATRKKRVLSKGLSRIGDVAVGEKTKCVASHSQQNDQT